MYGEKKRKEEERKRKRGEVVKFVVGFTLVGMRLALSRNSLPVSRDYVRGDLNFF